ncbi:GPI mannosyltransferase 3 isoform X1 [Sigmodon hispidus]
MWGKGSGPGSWFSALHCLPPICYLHEPPLRVLTRCREQENIELKRSQVGAVLHRQETHPLPAAFPAVVVLEQPLRRRLSGSNPSGARPPARKCGAGPAGAAGLREAMEAESGDHGPAFRSLHSRSREMKLRKRKSTLYVDRQEKRSRPRGECGMLC